MERYSVVKVIGDGTYGTVCKGVIKDTGEFVAIKKMKKKFFSWDECLELREIKSLRKFTHPNIIKLKEVIRANDDLYLVFEFLPQNIVQITRERVLEEDEIKSITHQTLKGLSYMHKLGYYHRDMKPDNLMIDGNLVKIIDFGLAREIRSRPPYTDYVSTRWYRAPEVLLHSTTYSWPIDIFAIGCIVAELYLRRPLFPGTSEVDQIAKLCSVLGTPQPTDWQDGYRLAGLLGYSFPQFATTPLSLLIPNASNEALEFIACTLQWDPMKRPSADQCLLHPYFGRQTSALRLVVPDGHLRALSGSPRLSPGPEPTPVPQLDPAVSRTLPRSLAPNPSLPSLSIFRDTDRMQQARGGLGQYGAALLGRNPQGPVGQGRHRFS